MHYLHRTCFRTRFIDQGNKLCKRLRSRVRMRVAWHVWCVYIWNIWYNRYTLYVCMYITLLSRVVELRLLLMLSLLLVLLMLLCSGCVRSLLSFFAVVCEHWWLLSRVCVYMLFITDSQWSAQLLGLPSSCCYYAVVLQC